MSVVRVFQYNSRTPKELSDAIVDRVLDKLKDLARVPHDVTRARGRRPAASTQSRATDSSAGHKAGVEMAAADVAQRRQALAVQQRTLGPDHFDVLSSMTDLSIRLAWSGQHEAAVDMARQVLEAQQRVHGPDHPDTLSSMAGLSTRLAWSGQHEAAVSMTRQVLRARQRVLGPDHRDTLRSMTDLAKLGQHGTPVDAGAPSAAHQALVTDAPAFADHLGAK